MGGLLRECRVSSDVPADAWVFRVVYAFPICRRFPVDCVEMAVACGEDLASGGGASGLSWVGGFFDCV